MFSKKTCPFQHIDLPNPITSPHLPDSLTPPPLPPPPLPDSLTPPALPLTTIGFVSLIAAMTKMSPEVTVSTGLCRPAGGSGARGGVVIE